MKKVKLINFWCIW